MAINKEALLNNLKTIDKSSIVNAVNEVKTVTETNKNEVSEVKRVTETNKNEVERVQQLTEVNKSEILSVKNIVAHAVTKTEEVEAELRAFRIALSEGITANQFSDGLSTMDGFIIYDGYFNETLGRIEG